MKHIRQKTSSREPKKVYSVVKTDDWVLPLEEHPSIIQHPELFELVDEDLPSLDNDDYGRLEYMIYISEN